MQTLGTALLYRLQSLPSILVLQHLVNACEVKAHPIKCWQNLGAVCFWQPIPFGLNPVVVAVLRDSLCRVIAALRGRLCYILERFVLTN